MQYPMGLINTHISDSNCTLFSSYSFGVLLVHHIWSFKLHYQKPRILFNITHKQVLFHNFEILEFLKSLKIERFNASY